MSSPLRLLPRQGQGSVTAWLPKASSIGPLRHLLPTTGSLVEPLFLHDALGRAAGVSTRE